MKKLKKIMKTFNKLGVDYKQTSPNEISIPIVCNVNNSDKLSCNYTYEEWLKNNNTSVLCDDCESFAIKIYEDENGISITGMIDYENIKNN